MCFNLLYCKHCNHICFGNNIGLQCFKIYYLVLRGSLTVTLLSSPFLSALFPLWQCFVRLAQVLVWSGSCAPPAVQPPAEVRQKRKLKQRGMTKKKKKRGWLYRHTAAEKISFMLKERKWHQGERQLWLPAEAVASGWDWAFLPKSSCISWASVGPDQLAHFYGLETLVIICLPVLKLSSEQLCILVVLLEFK